MCLDYYNYYLLYPSVNFYLGCSIFNFFSGRHREQNFPNYYVFPDRRLIKHKIKLRMPRTRTTVSFFIISMTTVSVSILKKNILALQQDNRSVSLIIPLTWSMMKTWQPTMLTFITERRWENQHFFKIIFLSSNTNKFISYILHIL